MRLGLGLHVGRSRAGAGGGGGGTALTADSWYYSGSESEVWGPAAMSVAREGASAVEHDGLIYVIGGYNGTSVLTTVEVYDPAANEWTTLDPLPAARWLGMAFAIGGVIYFTGGASDSAATVLEDDTYAYTIATDTWETLSSDPLPSVGINGSTAVFDSIGYVVFLQGGTSAYAFDPTESAGSRWSFFTTSTASGPGTRARGAFGQTGGQLYIAGGTDSSADRNDTQSFDPSAGSNFYTDITTDDMPVAKQRLGRGDAVLSGKLYAPGGTASGSVVATHYEFDPSAAAASRWVTRTAMQTGVRYPAIASVGGILYAIGGQNSGGTALATVQAYVPPAGANKPF